MMTIDLSGRTALVCGSTRGIGRAVAQELATLGATIVLIARNESALQQTLQALPTASKQAHRYICADFTHPEQVKQRVETHLQAHPRVDILVNNTGGPPPGPAIEAEPEAYLTAFRQHLLCNQILAQAVVPGMKERGYGRIINIISTSVKQPIPGLGVSNTVRGAVAGWAKTLARELAPYGITVNNVLPGATRTRRLAALIRTKAEQAGVPVEEMERRMMQEIPAGRFAEPEEIARAVAFLASPAAAYITGVNLPVDGGRTGCL
ncbi:MAG: SDR family oxidoreductase [Calditrichaeota bacterium]|nr:MAG: SDR family oxidoreductase [Calditrichota bacterium]